jgi:hypothetical protein
MYVLFVGLAFFELFFGGAEQNKHVITRRTISVNADSSSIRGILLRILYQILNEPHTKMKWHSEYMNDSLFDCAAKTFSRYSNTVSYLCSQDILGAPPNGTHSQPVTLVDRHLGPPQCPKK